MVSVVNFIITRNMAPDPTVFVCPSCKAKLNAMQKTSMLTCTACRTEVDVKVLRGRVTEIWNALEQEADQLQVGFVPCSLFLSPHVQSWRPAKDPEEIFISFTSRYGQLLDLVSHPCRLLYKVGFLSQYLFSCFHDFLWFKAEQYFWKAQRRARGNKSYMHQVEKHLCC